MRGLTSSVFIALALVVGVLFFQGCNENLHPETREMKRELEDSLVHFMKIPDDAEFFRKYIAFNVRFTLRHKMALNDTIINKELKDVLSKMALVQAAQRRIDVIQQANP